MGVRRASSLQRSAIGLAVCLLAPSLLACGDSGGTPAAPVSMLAVVTAFPAELAPLLEQTTVDDTTDINGRMFRIGTLAGVPVVLGMTGIGLVNAAATTRALLDQYDVDGVIMSGVAASPFRIGDVTVPDAWQLADGSRYAADRSWLAIARRIAGRAAAAFAHCTVPPRNPELGEVCLDYAPQVVLGGIGQSSDGFGNRAFECQPGGDDVFGCDVPTSAAAHWYAAGIAATDAEPVDNDEETAAVAREAATRGVKFIAFRAVSDGAGDPLGLSPHSFQQFFTYYRLAAQNAAAATRAFLAHLAAR
jgi:nucleoside phosphorylase